MNLKELVREFGNYQDTNKNAVQFQQQKFEINSYIKFARERFMIDQKSKHLSSLFKESNTFLFVSHVTI